MADALLEGGVRAKAFVIIADILEENALGVLYRLVQPQPRLQLRIILEILLIVQLLHVVLPYLLHAWLLALMIGNEVLKLIA